MNPSSRPTSAPLAGARSARKAVVRANNAFAADLYRQLVPKGEGNLFFSPFSLSTALAMTYAGARGETASEMAKALRFTAPAEQVHPAFKELLAGVDSSEECELAVANRLWGQKGVLFLPAFLELERDLYGAPLEQLDFSQSEASRKTINRWVAFRTKSRIEDLVPEGVLTDLTRLVLTNALYFKGAWENPFEATDTAPASFWTGSTEVQAPLMHQVETFGYGADGKDQVLLMPYLGGLEMMVVLPRARDGLADLEKGLTAEHLTASLASVTQRRVEAFLPRFKTTCAFSANEPLNALGMRLAFTDGAADFSGMSEQKDLYLSAVIHKAFIDVNEAGTEAAAATATAVDGLEDAACLEAPPPVFRADHPFLFLIRDKKSGAILFLGRVVSPTE